jgi:hypothetical protein
MNIDWSKAFDAVVHNPFVVGAVGAIVSLKYAPGDKWFDRAQNVFGGSVCAGYGTPFLVEWMGWTSPHITVFAGFVIGLVSMTLVAEILQAVKGVKWSDLLVTLITSFTSARAKNEPPKDKE